MNNTKLIELPHITRTNIVKIAKAAKVSRYYVWMILNNEREAKSIKAKAIVTAAKSINTAIETRLVKLETETTEID